MKTYIIVLMFISLLFIPVNKPEAALIQENETNNTFDSAQNLDGYFSTDIFDYNQNGICDIPECNSIPHVTVEAEGDGTFDYFSFYYTAGSKLIVDIDYNSQSIWLVAFEAQSHHRIFDEPFRPSNDTIDLPNDNITGFFTNVTPSTGRIILAIVQDPPAGNYGYLASHWPNGTNGYSGGSYYLHVSLENPSPVPEPATILLVGIGFIGIGTFFRKRRCNNQI